MLNEKFKLKKLMNLKHCPPYKVELNYYYTFANTNDCKFCAIHLVVDILFKKIENIGQQIIIYLKVL